MKAMTRCVRQWLENGVQTILELSNWINTPLFERSRRFGWQAGSTILLNMNSPNQFASWANSPVQCISVLESYT